MTDNNKKLSPEEVEEQTVNVAQVQFFQLNRLLNQFKRKKISRKGCIRAIVAALNFGITDVKVNLKNDEESQLAQVIAEMLGPRTIMQAEVYKRLEKKEKDNGREEKK